jgi:hypothetical protein
MSEQVYDVRYAIRTAVKSPEVYAMAIALALGMVAQSAHAGSKAEAGSPLGEISVAAGRWEGSVQIPGSGLRVVIDLAQNSEGGWTGSQTTRLHKFSCNGLREDSTPANPRKTSPKDWSKRR